MKYETVIKRLGRFGFCVDEKGHYFWTRNEALKNRLVKVYNQNGRAVAIPVFIEADGSETVVFHAKTIKQLEQFLEGN